MFAQWREIIVSYLLQFWAFGGSCVIYFGSVCEFAGLFFCSSRFGFHRLKEAAMRMESRWVLLHDIYIYIYLVLYLILAIA